MPDAAPHVLRSETAMRIALWVRRAGYEVEASPRASGADLAASRDGTVWLTFHIDADRHAADRVRVGATAFGGARVGFGAAVPREAPDAGLEAYVQARLEVACQKGREQNPRHCEHCPAPGHAAIGA